MKIAADKGTKSKRCTKCKRTQLIENFGLHARSRDGRASWCKACKRQWDNNRTVDREKARAASRRFWGKHRNKCLKQAAQFRAENPNYHQQYRSRNRRTFREAARKWQQEHPERVSAQIAAKVAKRAGRLVSPGSCEVCHRRVSLDMHHQDYSRPLAVIWLCRKCHGRVHTAVGELRRIAG